MELNDNEKINGYLNSICFEIKNSKIHSYIQEEVRSHIEEIALEYIDGGFYEGEAVNNAIAQMGDATLIGTNFNKVYKQKPEWSIVILTSIFAVLGLSLIFLIDYSGILGYSLFSKSVVGTVIGVFCAAFFYYFDYMKIKSYSLHIYIVTVIFMLLTIIYGTQSSGKPYLLIIMPINFMDISPSLLTISLAGMLIEFNCSDIKRAIYGITLLVFPFILMTASHSFSAALPYCASVIVLLIMSGVKTKKLCVFLVSSLSAFSFYLLMAPYHMQRLLVFLNINSDILGKRAFNIQINNLIQSSGKFGHGLNFDGKVLPEVHTDFVFTYIVYSFGWISGLLLALLIVMFLVRMANITFYVKNSYGKLLISGLTSIFAIQFLYSILMNLGFVPITSINLPFISYGSSQFVINMAVIGIISNVYKQRSIPIRIAS